MSEEERRAEGRGRRASDRQPIDELKELCEQIEKRHVEEMRVLKTQVRQTRAYVVTLFVITFLAGVGAAWFLVHEANIREDGQCRIFESDQQEEREELADTYSYLHGAQKRGGRATRSLLYEFAIARLPVTFEKAQEDQAPDYCDDGDVGLAEPDFPMPEPPRGLELPELPPG